MPHPKVVTLAPEQVAVLLDAADQSPSPWLGPWTVLAAATGARNGELCGPGWADLDLDAGTIRFRQALTIVDPTLLPDGAAAADGGALAQRVYVHQLPQTAPRLAELIQGVSAGRRAEGSRREIPAAI